MNKISIKREMLKLKMAEPDKNNRFIDGEFHCDGYWIGYTYYMINLPEYILPEYLKDDAAWVIE